MANDLTKHPTDPTMSGASLVGRVVAIEAFVVEAMAMLIAPLPDDQEAAALAKVTETARDFAVTVGHRVAAERTEEHVESLMRAIQMRLEGLRKA